MEISDEPTPETTARWDAFLRHDEFGSAVSIQAVPLDADDRTDGGRQSWQYSVIYPNEKTTAFVFPYPSLPFDIDENLVLQRLPGIARQSYAEQQRSAAFKLLRQRNYLEHYNDDSIK